ncbi:KRAB-A domain-containing protein 2-like [Macrobrachium nipponense]|uniref:KRAB-A domain-containing protein 2-like n=1 Tax=Macrobrachium nipponense TaxID=159736 RepID=UPI0030C7B5FD
MTDTGHRITGCSMSKSPCWHKASLILNNNGTPATPHQVLQSDNGREFVNSVISELSTLWPQLQLVTGRPRHPQSQGAVERLNGVIQDKLKIWMRENNSKKWSIGLKFVQWQVNISKHETTKATFGEEPSVGLSSTNLPESVLDGICYEEDLDKFFIEDGNYGEREDNESRKTDQQLEDEEVPEQPESEKGLKSIEEMVNAIDAIRENVDISQAQSASKMIRRGMRMQESLQVEDNATL